MIGEFDIYGVYLPSFLVFATIAFLLHLAVKRMFDTWGIYRYVWHRPLFDLAIFVVLLGAVTAGGSAIVAL